MIPPGSAMVPASAEAESSKTTAAITIPFRRIMESPPLGVERLTCTQVAGWGPVRYFFPPDRLITCGAKTRKYTGVAAQSAKCCRNVHVRCSIPQQLGKRYSRGERCYQGEALVGPAA